MESQGENRPKFHPDPGLNLMDQVREVLRYYHYAYRIQQTYCNWIPHYIHYFGGKIHDARAALSFGDIFSKLFSYIGTMVLPPPVNKTKLAWAMKREYGANP